MSTSKIETPFNITTLDSEIPDSITNLLANATLGSNINKKVIGVESISYK